MIQFLDMGGYAPYVWPSYAIVIAGIILNIVWARRSLRQARQAARRRLATRGEGQ
jgi:heme exporter protein CcmD